MAGIRDCAQGGATGLLRPFPAMAFNLKLVLKALLFSSSQPLTIKDIQTIFTRYHDQAQAPLFVEETEGGEAPSEPVPEIAADFAKSFGEPFVAKAEWRCRHVRAG